MDRALWGESLRKGVARPGQFHGWAVERGPHGPAGSPAPGDPGAGPPEPGTAPKSTLAGQDLDRARPRGDSLYAIGATISPHGLVS